MKLLLVAPYPIFPTMSGGQIRIVELSRHLCQLGIRVSIMTPFHYAQRADLYSEEPFRIIQVKYPLILPFLLANRHFPYMYLASFHPGFSFLLNRLFESFHLYQFEHVAFGDLVNSVPLGRPVIYDAHNVEYDYAGMASRSKGIARIATKRTFRLEARLVGRASHVFACSKEDRDRLCKLYGSSRSKISLARNGVNLHEKNRYLGGPAAMLKKFPQMRSFPRRAIYSGSDAEHNRVAVEFILKHLAPSVKDFAFIIHGGCGEVFKSTLVENVFFDPDPENSNFRIYACPGTVALNPVTQGSGTNLKLLQYIMHGLPVVSTPFGVRGYEDLCTYVTSASLENFASVLRKSIHFSPTCQLNLDQHYDWHNIAKHMRTVYCALLSRCRSSKSTSRYVTIPP